MLKKLWGTMLAVTLVSTSLMGCSTESAKPAATEAAAQASEEKTAAPAADVYKRQLYGRLLCDSAADIGRLVQGRQFFINLGYSQILQDLSLIHI